MENIWDNISQSWWLKESARTPDELSALLDRVGRRLEPGTFERFMLPNNWEKVKKEITETGGAVPLYKDQRGPVTFAMSLYSTENLIFLIMDNPDAAKRLSGLIGKAMLKKIKLHLKEAGNNENNFPHGFDFTDDNCSLLNYDMYMFFAHPILDAVFYDQSPDSADGRYQHSDSVMEHILPALSKLQLTGTNFGSNIMVDTIRSYLPRAVIRGELAPYIQQK
ncbi:MAG: hypothetical protein A2096_06035 [Spirochaetes bacterium GWF1_41_5]|nr:MAG: hypothetical protein A2096_06035 [Spirochaetes bacterium GWF1_41_5]HBE03059.1 hypothetical protein [Spirochaetia bacterium]